MSDHIGKLFIAGAIVVLGGIAGTLYGCPKYRVWQQGLEGEAELARAEQNRKIKVQEAEAEKAAASLKAAAEVERAKGVRDANAIVADGLKGHEEYLRYLWITQIAGHANREIIYLPSEGGLPVLEAGKR